MPCFHDGLYTFVFLYKYCIYAVDTQDFVHYNNLRIVLQNGTPEEQDWHAATGSVCKKGELYYLYYTGFCEGNRNKEGKFEQAILRAVSTDFVHWKKDRDYYFAPDTSRFAGVHWRDPHVFYQQELHSYCMLVTACEKDGAWQRSGCTAVYQSEDMLEWTYYKTICSPGIYPTHECQDVFQIGNRHYLTFSTYEKQWETRYRIADQFDGPWKVPEADDRLEGRDFYAAKTVSDGTHRYLVGWQAIRKNCSNQGRYLWGGNVVVHELIQREDGTLGTVMPATIQKEFVRCIGSATDVRLTSKEGFSYQEIATMSNVCLIHTTLYWRTGTYAVGIMFHTDGERMEQWCQLRLELTHGRFTIERSGKTESDQFFDEERPIHFRKQQAEVKILTSNDIIVAYVDDVALSGRCYGATVGMTGLFCEYGEVSADIFEVYSGNEQNVME